MKKQPNGKYIETLKHGNVWLGKRRDNGIWYIRCPVPNSTKAIFRSTRVTEKRSALKDADLLHSQVLNKRYGVADGTIPLKQLIDKFIEAKDGRVKHKSLQRLVSSINAFMAWLATSHPDVKLARHLTNEITREFQKHRRGHDCEGRTVDNDIKNLNSMALWAAKENYMASSPFDYSRRGNINLYDEDEEDRDVYTEPEYRALIAAAEAANDILTRDLIVVFAGTGMRYQELTHLMPKCIDWGSEIPAVRIFAHDGWSPKDRHEKKYVPMLPEVQEVIRRRCGQCKSESEFLFKSSTGNRLHDSHPRETLQSLFERVGIAPHRRLHWHSFRNYFVIYCLDHGVSIKDIMMMTGHDSAAMVLHYAKAGRENGLKNAFRRMTTDWSGIGKPVLQVEKTAHSLALSA